MRATVVVSLATGLLTIGTAMAATPAVPPYIAAAVAAPARPATDTQRDINRKPAEVLAFAGVKPGDKVLELIPGSGYYTQLLCRVVGSKGHVDTVTFARRTPQAKAPTAPPATADCAENVSWKLIPATGVSFPGGMDLVWTSENYHDLNNDNYGPEDMKSFNKAVFDALKPGGVFLVEDHAAAAGSGARDTNTLHRIDVERVKQDLASVGFVLEASSDVLRRSDDPLTARAHELEGKTSKFLLRFRKPAR